MPEEQMNELRRLIRLDQVARQYFGSTPGSQAERVAQEQLLRLLDIEAKPGGETVSVEPAYLARIEQLLPLIGELAFAQGREFARALDALLKAWEEGSGQ